MRTSPVGGRTARIFAAAGAGCVVTSLFLVACGSEPDGTVSSTVAGPSTTEVIADSAPTSASRGSSVLPTTPTVIYRPPFIERVEWTETEVGPSLSVFPTTSGRYTQDPTGMAAAWAEVVALDPSADTPGMQAQFDCHWRFARIIEPEKPSWNLEPGRPVVTEEDMIGARCNPGFAEEY